MSYESSFILGDTNLMVFVHTVFNHSGTYIKYNTIYKNKKHYINLMLVLHKNINQYLLNN